ncbi:MAG: ATP-binding protein, partial [Burkholderiaceae bacterium]|nr:ATP-binding protein [Burkholderiaceae bacterium]
NPCPCGYLGSGRRACACAPGVPARYRQRLSGPLLDRIDLQIDVLSIDTHELLGNAPAGGSPDADHDPAGSAQAAHRVALARERSRHRQQDPNAGPNATLNSGLNAGLTIAQIERHCRPGDEARALLHSAARRFQWSARALHRVLRVARTIADLAGHDELLGADIAEAVHYRRSAILALSDSGDSLHAALQAASPAEMPTSGGPFSA